MKDIPSGASEYFIDWARNLLGHEVFVERERHGDEGVVFKIDTEKGNYFLKIKVGSNFSKERGRLNLLKNKLPVPVVVGYTEKDGTGAMLLTAIEGRNLAVLCKEWPAERVITKFAEVLHIFHATNTHGLLFDSAVQGGVLVHGDACLPNFIFNEEVFSGYIDLADCRIANPEVDLSAAVWSIQYNLGPGHGSAFLKEYGYRDTSEESAKILRLQYEEYQREHGFL